ncbi:hypothetical protein [Petroclostridium sp. X23]|uniref:hypothetical protein n=1 Tax=Petroclostridium sp. X23 TaxID=3045146 RepID=UPI0024ADD8C6|nr:hypothetical protein [Petroclostridium sp. X23]WHH57339.1 hypothetical protein QKW49_16065 [Petroclostridium sp. X23]
MVKRLSKTLLICMGVIISLTACGARVVNRTGTKMAPGEIAVKSVTHDADKVLKLGDKVHIKVEVENFDPELTAEMGTTEIFARIANQPGEIILRNDGTLGDTAADDSFFEGEYVVNEKSKRVVDGKIAVNTYREEVFSNQSITIQP